MRICVDSSFVAPIFLPEDWSDQAKQRAQRWLAQGVTLVAPDLWAYEVVSIVFKAVLRGGLSPDEGRPTLSAFLTFPITFIQPPGYEAAYTLAMAHRLPAPYDAQYLAVAETEGIEFWTGDRKLYDRVHAALAWVHWLGE